ncbi:MAG TPA: SDR family oxidoreductase [Tepidisphaeraceae bacterium]|jgi:NAD(P)-dependent dehydrogenase (short-subunit alcohol dehydrogenase family)
MTYPAQNLAGQTAIISGGLGDIGRAVAVELAHRGANIAVGDVKGKTEAGGLLEQLATLRVNARYDHVDVSDAEAVRQWVGDVERQLGAAALIIPNAAIVTLADVRHLSSEQWNRELRINLDGAFHLAQAGVLRLVELEKAGRVVFVGSWAAHAPHAHIPAYCAAKAGLRMLMQCMALEFAPYGILVNEVAPGYVDAGLSKQLMDCKPGSREEARRAVPINKLIQPEDVARQVAHLCDPLNEHMTGSVILMDGGLSLRRVH